MNGFKEGNANKGIATQVVLLDNDKKKGNLVVALNQIKTDSRILLPATTNLDRINV